VTGPAWATALLAGLMLLVAVSSVIRLALWRLTGRAAEPEVDTLHVLMGTAMAGMLEPRFSLLPDVVWEAVFGVAAAWFVCRTVRARVRGHRASAAGRTVGGGCAHPVAHSVECAAMIYMLVPAEAAGHGSVTVMPGMAMRGTSGPASAANPALALILAMFMLGYIFWIADRLKSQTHTGPDTALAPRLAAFSKIAMSFAMGYMLLMTL
jgi:hypothetical protein